MALNYVYVFIALHTLISELSSYYFCYKGFVQQPSLHPYVRGLCSENVCTETIFMALCFNIRGIDIVKLCFCINCCIWSTV